MSSRQWTMQKIRIAIPDGYVELSLSSWRGGCGMLRFIVLLILALSGFAGARAADLYTVNGKVFTGDASRPFAEALAIRDGRILAVGDTGEITALARRDGTSPTIDLGGRLVIPGLIDAHAY